MTTSLLSDLQIVQNAFVVADLDDGIEMWTAVFGAGPFLVKRDHGFASADFSGRPVDIKMSVAFGQCGGLQIELIQPLPGTGDSPWGLPGSTAHLGFNHVAVMPDDPDRFIAVCGERGMARTFRGETAMGSVMSFIDARAVLGGHIEVYEDVVNVGPVYQQVREASEGWDGVTDPIREL